MKICLLADARSVHIQRIAPGLAARGAAVHIVTHKPTDVAGATVERFRVPPAGLASPFRWRNRWRRMLRDYMRTFDVVHVHFLADWGFTPELIEEGCFVASPWGSDIVPPPGEGHMTDALLTARMTMLRHAACVTAWGPWFASTVASFAGIAVEGIEILPLGVELDVFRPPSGLPHEPHVGFFKGFRPVYGASYLIQAIPRIIIAVPAARFTMIGNGPQLAECQGMAERLGIVDRIDWLPRRNREKMPAQIAAWQLSVIPSLSESFGAAALESSAMGVPVVASNVGGLPETVRHGETGLLVPPQSPEAIAEAVIHLLQNPQLRRRFSRAGRAFVEREYDWTLILDKWMRTYETALERSCVMT